MKGNLRIYNKDEIMIESFLDVDYVQMRDLISTILLRENDMRVIWEPFSDKHLILNEVKEFLANDCDDTKQNYIMLSDDIEGFKGMDNIYGLHIVINPNRKRFCQIIGNATVFDCNHILLSN